MSKVRRVYAEKKEAYAGAAKDLAHEIRSYLGISGLEKIRILIRYDIENISDDVYEEAKTCVFAEPPVDILYEEEFTKKETDRVFAVEYLPGQFDQRADSAVQCIRFLNENEEVLIRTATVYVLEGSLSDEDMKAIEEYCYNPVDSRPAGLGKPQTLEQKFEEPEDIRTFDGFTSMEEDKFRDLYDSLGLAMTFRDFHFIREYFSQEEHRDPTVTEIRVLDTYWSDHCRHTTFSTELKNVSFDDGYYREPIEAAFRRYLEDRLDVYGDRKDKFVCLMDLATMGARKLKKDGLLEDQEETDEINACSIVVPV